MNVVAIVSAKGGVGKTTTTVNLGIGLAKRGIPVLVVDLDPQNALRWHLGGVDPEEEHLEDGGPVPPSEWHHKIYTSPFGVDFVPYGAMTDDSRLQFERQLEQDDNWLADRLHQSGLPENAFVLIDTPPGPSVYLKQAMRVANFALVVLLADAASFATVSPIDALLAFYGKDRSGFLGAAFVLNQVSESRLATDVALTLRTRLQRRLAPYAVQRSDAVAEALGF
jgi:cellulose synthase operon protein YhjQ